MDKAGLPESAILSSAGAYTMFSHGDVCIRFRTSQRLEYYSEIKKWDSGYIEVMAKYQGLPEIEEYIDLIPILEDLYIEPEEFLKPIQKVRIQYEQ